ncbi:hypothetical protein HDU91_001016 [Kappamyces sp. JEL0680]|nr:hypothetical protein HDU91_001016 [Kappamyces sp. JEL0680]
MTTSRLSDLHEKLQKLQARNGLALVHQWTLAAQSKQTQRIKGGSAAVASDPAEIPRFIVHFLNRKLRETVAMAPVTTLQVCAGLGFFTASALLPTGASSLLFHPQLLIQNAQWWRVPLGFATIATTPLGLARSVASLVAWQVPLESLFYTLSRDRPAPGAFPESSDWNDSDSDSPIALFSLERISLRFIETIALNAAIITLVEMLFYPDAHTSSAGPFTHVYPYSLFPILMQSTQWLWALLSNENTNSMPLLGGLISLEPIHIPLGLLAMNGFDYLEDSLKGLFAALVSCYLLKLKRWDGVNAFHFFTKTAQRWNREFKRLLRSVTKK